eukprot:2198997-Prymnesium_polylepis.1
MTDTVVRSQNTQPRLLLPPAFSHPPWHADVTSQAGHVSSRPTRTSCRRTRARVGALGGHASVVQRVPQVGCGSRPPHMAVTPTAWARTRCPRRARAPGR